MFKNKKLLMFLMAVNAAYGANVENGNTGLDTKYDKLYTKMVKNIDEGKTNGDNYKLIENILNTKNKELADLYLQNDYIIKPEFLEWQVFYNAFYNHKNRGKGGNTENLDSNGISDKEAKSISLGMVIPIKNVNDRNINMEMSLVPTPNIEFNSGKIGAVNVNPIDLDYEKNDLLFIATPIFNYSSVNGRADYSTFGNVTNEVKYSTSGRNIFENLNLSTVGNTKGLFTIRGEVVDVSGNMSYENADYGVSGTVNSNYTHTLDLHSSLGINNISMNGDYKIQGDWDITMDSQTSWPKGFISYKPIYITKDGTVTYNGNLNLDNPAGANGILAGMILDLDITNSLTSGLEATLVNNGIITSVGGRTYGMMLIAPQADKAKLNLLNNNIINMNSKFSSYGLFSGVGIHVIFPSMNVGEALVKTGNINLNGEKAIGVNIASRNTLGAPIMDSKVDIDGSGGIINVNGKDNIGLYLSIYNGQIVSNNGFENMKNMSISLDGDSATGIYIDMKTEEEKNKNMILDNSVIRSISFGDNSENSFMFNVSSGSLIIDKSMESVLGEINKGSKNHLVSVRGGNTIINYSDVNIGAGAKAMSVFSTGGSLIGNEGRLENHGNIVNNSSEYNNNGGVAIFASNNGTVINTGNIEMNGDKATAISNRGFLDSKNDYIIVNGNNSVALGGLAINNKSTNNVSSNKIEVTGNESVVFYSSGGDFTLSPNTNSSLEATIDGRNSVLFFSQEDSSLSGDGKYTINGKVNGQVKNGAIAIGYEGYSNRTNILNIGDLFDTSNGELNIHVDDNSYALSIVGASLNLSGISNLGSQGINLTGSQKSRLNWGILYIDEDSNLDKNNTTGSKIYRDMEVSLSDITLKEGVTITGSEDSQLGMAQSGMVYYGIIPMYPSLLNEGKISLTGSNTVGIYAKKGTIKNTGTVETIGDNGIGLFGKVADVTNDGTIKIGNHGIGIYAETLLKPSDYDTYGASSSIINAGSIIAESGEKAIGIYAIKNTDSSVTTPSNNSITLNSGTNIDVSKSVGGIGIYTDKSDVTGTGVISVGKDGVGVYAKDSDVNLNNMELNLLGDNAVGIYTDGITSFTGNGTINIDGKGIVVFNNLSSGVFNQNFDISSTEGSTYVFQNMKNSEIYSNGTIKLSEGGMYNYGQNSAILLGTNSVMTSFNNTKNDYESRIIGIALSGANSNGTPTIIGGQSVSHEATNMGTMHFGDESSGMYVMDGASALNSGEISLGKNSVGILGKGTGTSINNANLINIKEGSVGLFLNNGKDINNSGTINGTGNKIVGIYSDTANASNIKNTGSINLTGDRTVGVYMTGSGSQAFENTGNITVGHSSNQTDPSIGVYNNTENGLVINTNLIKAGDNSIGIYNKSGIIKQTSGSIEAGADGMGIYSDSGRIELTGGSINLNGTNAVGIYAINQTQIDNNANINMLDGNYGIVLNTGSDLINRKAQTLGNDGVFVYSKGGSNILSETGADLIMNGSRNVGFYMSDGGTIINKASITANTGDSNIGIYNKEGTIDNSGDIKVGDSLIVDPDNSYANSYSVGLYGDKTIDMKNTGNIEVGESGVGFYTRGSVNESLNTGDITSLSDSAIGIFVDNGSIKNEGNITLSGDKSIGIAGERSSQITNAGTINMNGNDSIGIYANLNSKVVNTNTGIININGNNSTGIQLSSGSVLENYGQINLASGITGSKNIDNGTGSYIPPSIINAGVIKVDEKFELDGLTLTIKVDPSTMRIPTLEEITVGGYDYDDINSGFLVSNGTSIKAPSFDFNGNSIGIDPSFTQGTNARVYKFENVFDPNTPEGGPNTGIVSLKSMSLSFDAIPVVNENTGGIDVWMEKINYDKFTDGTWYDGFAGNIESNYLGATGNALKLYDKLDMIKDERDLANSFEQLAGDTYANITQREQDITGVFKNTLEILQNSENNTKENVKVSIIAGKGTTKEDTTGVVNYDYNTVGAMALREVERTYKHKFGYSLGYSRTDFEFDGTKDKDRADTIQIGLHNKYLLGDWEIKNDLLGRVSFHDVDRSVNWYDGSSSKLNSDYNVYGISSFNEIGKRIDLGNNLKVVPYAGLELGYMTHSSFEESGGAESLKVDSNDAYSIKPGIGVRLEGEKALGVTENWKLKGNLGIGYEYELGDMNKQEKASLKEIEQGYHKLAKTAEEKGSFRTAGSIGLELKERYTVSLIGEYRIGESDQEDYRTGINLKAVF